MDIAGVVSGGLGLLVALIAFWRTMKRESPQLASGIGGVLIVYNLQGDADYLLCDLTFSNLSDSGNSIIEYGLSLGPPYEASTRPVHYGETVFGESVLEPALGSPFSPDKLALKEKQLEWLSNPVNLLPHESRIGYVGFPLPSIPKDIVKGVPFVLWIVPSEGKPISIHVDLRTMQWTAIEGGIAMEKDVVV